MTRDIVVIGASAGGVPALKSLIGALPVSFPAAIFVVLHIRAGVHSRLAEILARSSVLPVAQASDRATFAPGHVYVAREDLHLLLERDCMRAVRGPKENRHRPAVDPLFRSAAYAHGRRVIGVVLTGLLDDGAAGLWAIKQCGGLTMVQDPRDAAYADMPINAVATTAVDEVVSLAELPERLTALTSTPLTGEDESPRPPSIETEVRFAKGEGAMDAMDSLGHLSPFTCPSCRGSLWELRNGDLVRYRCHTGHAFSREGLLTEQTAAIETALYSALRAVDEKATALRRLAERNDAMPRLSQEFTARAVQLDETGHVLRSLLETAPE